MALTTDRSRWCREARPGWQCQEPLRGRHVALVEEAVGLRIEVCPSDSDREPAGEEAPSAGGVHLLRRDLTSGWQPALAPGCCTARSRATHTKRAVSCASVLLRLSCAAQRCVRLSPPLCSSARIGCPYWLWSKEWRDPSAHWRASPWRKLLRQSSLWPQDPERSALWTSWQFHRQFSRQRRSA